MAFDGYIQIAEIPGEALDEKYNKWIEITSYSFGVSQSTSATASSSGGATSGRTTVSNFTFTKYLDSASCKLMEQESGRISELNYMAPHKLKKKIFVLLLHQAVSCQSLIKGWQSFFLWK